MTLDVSKLPDLVRPFDTTMAQALMSSFLWLPPGSCAAQLVPELLRSILQDPVNERLSPRAKAAGDVASNWHQWSKKNGRDVEVLCYSSSVSRF